MGQDKQLHGISLEAVVQKRTLDQALNAKEFSVLADISYSKARAWFRQPGFPVFRGFVFWLDFVEWRKRQTGLNQVNGGPVPQNAGNAVAKTSPAKLLLPERAARILREASC